jgi:hypothetical protein
LNRFHTTIKQVGQIRWYARMVAKAQGLVESGKTQAFAGTRC